MQIANPVTYLVQKILIHGKRGREDRAKDILYMHDTLEVFGARLVELHELWRNDIAGRLHLRSTRAALKASHVLFGHLSDDIRRSAEISAERALSPEAIREACSYGLSNVFKKV